MRLHPFHHNALSNAAAEPGQSWDIGQAKGVKGKAEKGKKGKRKGKDKDEKDNGEAKGRAQITLTLLALVGRDTRKPSARSRRRSKEANLRPQRFKRSRH